MNVETMSHMLSTKQTLTESYGYCTEYYLHFPYFEQY